MRWAGKASQRGWYLLCIRSGMGGGLQTGWEEEARFPREARVGRTYQRWILTKHVQKPLLARVATSCKGAGFGEEKGVSASRQHTETQIHCISLITSSQPKKKKNCQIPIICKTVLDMGEGRGIKRKDLIQAQELVIKTGNVNNAKYTKQNQKKKKGKFANNYSICRGNQLFCLLNTFPFLLRIKEPFLTSEYCSPSPSTSPVVPTGATISSTALLLWQ